MNEHEIERIAAAMNQLRPDWPTKSLRTLLAKPQLADRPRRDVTVALAWVACETATATPARVLEAGPWWRAAAVEANGVRLEHLKPEDRCKTCAKSRTDCERNPWGDHEFEPDVFRPRDVDLAPVVAEVKSHDNGRAMKSEPAESVLRDLVVDHGGLCDDHQACACSMGRAARLLAASSAPAADTEGAS